MRRHRRLPSRTGRTVPLLRVIRIIVIVAGLVALVP